MSADAAIRIDATRFSYPGGRDYNEDFLGEAEAASGLHLFVVADGAGGHGGGDVAARTAVLAAQAAFRDLPSFTAQTLRRCVMRADGAVLEARKSHPRLAQMASTVAMVLVSSGARGVLLASLGDSRCYVFRGNQVMARSQDHSLVQRFIDAGLYPAAGLREHPRRNVLYASLGANEEGAEPYVLEPAAPIQAGDGMLVCSDGVWELLEDDELGELHASSDTVEQWRDRLLQALHARMPERHDNYSAYLLRCVPAREGPSPGSGA